MSKDFPRQHQLNMGKIGVPLNCLSMHQFLTERYLNLSDKLEDYLIAERDEYRTMIANFERRSAREDLNSWAYATLYPNTVRYSIFIIIYKHFEFTLTQVCIELEKDHPNKKKLSDLKDRGVSCAYTYLRKVAGITAPFEQHSWQKIKDLNSLRNIIIHNDAIIKNDDVKNNKTIERINQWAPVKIEETRTVLSKTFNKCVSQFLFEQADYVGKQLKSSGW